jgi:hypothetical protein
LVPKTTESTLPGEPLGLPETPGLPDTAGLPRDALAEGGEVGGTVEAGVGLLDALHAAKIRAATADNAVSRLVSTRHLLSLLTVGAPCAALA